MSSSLATSLPDFTRSPLQQIYLPRPQAVEDIKRQLLNKDRFVALLGTPGSGKSLFLKRELSTLFKDKSKSNGEDWRVVNFSPNANPIGSFAHALAQPNILIPQDEIEPFYTQQITETLRSDSEALVNIYSQAKEKSQENFKLLIVVDHLEELFYYQNSIYKQQLPQFEALKQHFKAGDDTTFFSLFRKAIKSDAGIYVVFSVSSDSLELFHSYQQWPELVSNNRYFLPELKSSDIRQSFQEQLKQNSPYHKKVEAAYITGAAKLYQEIIKDCAAAKGDIIIGTGDEENRKDGIKALSDQIGEGTPFQIQHGNSRDLLAKVNLSIYLLQQEAQAIIDRSAIDSPPATEKESSNTEGSEQNKSDQKLPTFIWSKDAIKVLTQQAINSNTELDKLAEQHITAYYAYLIECYRKFGGINGAFNQLGENIYANIQADQRVYVERLLKATSVKSRVAEVVADKHPELIANLLPICFRSEQPPQSIELINEFTSSRYIPQAEEKSDKELGINYLNDKIQPEQHKLLLSIIKAFDYNKNQSELLPTLITITDTNGQKHNSKISADSIIQIESRCLLQQWFRLSKLVADEYMASVSYSSLLGRAIEYFSSSNKQSPLSPKTEAPAKTKVPAKKNDSAQIRLRQFTTKVSNLLTDLTRDKKAAVKKRFTKLEAGGNEKILSKSRVYSYGEWFLNTLPNEYWARRYQDTKIQSLPPPLNEEASPKEFISALEKGGSTTLELTLNFLKKSEKYRAAEDEQKEINAARARHITRNRLRLVSSALVASLAMSIIASSQCQKANIAETNIELLDYVNTLSNANIISRNTLQSEEFVKLKNQIEFDKDITSREIVSAFLANEKILYFLTDADSLLLKDQPLQNEHGKLSVKALVELDNLYDIFSQRNADIATLVESGFEITARAEKYNGLKGNVDFQFPYIYQMLHQQRRLLNLILTRRSATEYQDDRITSNTRNERIKRYNEFLHENEARITSIISNPAPEASEQYVYGDTKGNVRLFVNDTMVPLGQVNESVSSMVYTTEGDQLFVGTYSGEMYRYNNVKLPVGLDSNLLQPSRICIEANRRSDKETITSIIPAQQGEFLILSGHTGISLLKKANTPSSCTAYPLMYTELDYIDVETTLELINAVAVDSSGKKIIVAGLGKSLILSIDYTGNKFMVNKRIDHPGVSITAINIQQQGDKHTVALGSETGSIYLTTLERLLSDPGSTLNSTDTYITGFQKSTITGLIFNESTTPQLISASLDGSIRIFNTALLSDVDTLYRDQKYVQNHIYDHIKLEANGNGVSQIALTNENELLAGENIRIRKWYTNINALQDDVEQRLLEYRKKPRH